MRHDYLMLTKNKNKTEILFHNTDKKENSSFHPVRGVSPENGANDLMQHEEASAEHMFEVHAQNDKVYSHVTVDTAGMWFPKPSRGQSTKTNPFIMSQQKLLLRLWRWVR